MSEEQKDTKQKQNDVIARILSDAQKAGMSSEDIISVLKGEASELMSIGRKQVAKNQAKLQNEYEVELKQATQGKRGREYAIAKADVKKKYVELGLDFNALGVF